MNIQIDLEANTFTVDGRRVPLRHHRAGLFLACLVQAGQHRQALEAAVFVLRWQQRNEQAAPDRTAMRRVVQAVQDALDAVPSLGAERLQFRSRAKTVGPWSLAMKPAERWHVAPLPAGAARGVRALTATASADATGTAAEPALASLAASVQPQPTLAVLAMVMVADDLARQAKFALAAQHLVEQAGNAALSAEGLAVLSLRQVRYWRRASLPGKALAALQAADAAARRAPPALRGGLQADCAVQRARLIYDANTVGQVQRLDLARLRRHVQVATSPRLNWEWANLQGLVLRARIDKLMPTARPQRAPALRDLALRAYAAALYWLAVAQDPYHTQAVIINYAYLLQRLAVWELAPTLGDAVEAYRLALTISHRFELLEDSAWDYIMLGKLWLMHPQVRKQVRVNDLLWPGGRSPSEVAFYERACELAQGSGDVRQHIRALDLHARYLRETGHGFRASQVLAHCNQLLAAHADARRQLQAEGFRQGGNR